MGRKPSDLIPMRVRIPHKTRQQIETMAKQNGRSLSEQIVYLLQNAVLAENAGLGGPEGVIIGLKHKHLAALIKIWEAKLPRT